MIPALIERRQQKILQINGIIKIFSVYRWRSLVLMLSQIEDCRLVGDCVIIILGCIGRQPALPAFLTALLCFRKSINLHFEGLKLHFEGVTVSLVDVNSEIGSRFHMNNSWGIHQLSNLKVVVPRRFFLKLTCPLRSLFEDEWLISKMLKFHFGRNKCTQ